MSSSPQKANSSNNFKNQGIQGEMKEQSPVKMESSHALLKYFKEHHNVSLIICIVGVIGLYSYYSYLQELL